MDKATEKVLDSMRTTIIPEYREDLRTAGLDPVTIEQYVQELKDNWLDLGALAGALGRVNGRSGAEGVGRLWVFVLNVIYVSYGEAWAQECNAAMCAWADLSVADAPPKEDPHGE